MLRMTEPSISIVKSVSRAVNAHVNAHWQKWFTRAASSVVDLGALELVGIIDVDGLPFGEEINGGDGGFAVAIAGLRSEEHTSELQSHSDLVCRLLLEKK